MDFFFWEVWPPNPKKLIFEYSSKELHFFFFFFFYGLRIITLSSEMRQNKSLARTLHLVLIALRGFSVYICSSLSSFSVVAFALYWALHTPNTRIPPHTSPAFRQRRTNDKSKGQEQGRDGSRAKPSQGGWVLGERERGDHRQQPPRRRAAAFQIDKQVDDT